MTIYEALSNVMSDVQGVKKGDRNSAPGQGGFMFRGIDAVTNAVGPALRKHGVIVAPSVIDYQYGTVIVGKNKTEMSHARLTIKFTWYGPDGDSVESITVGEAMDSGDKATAKAHSVAFRTAMIQTLCLPTDEPDPDEHTYERSEPEPADPLTVAKGLVWKLAQGKGMDRQALSDDYTSWSQGVPLGDATAEDLTSYAGTLK